MTREEERVLNAAVRLVNRWRACDTEWSDLYADDVRQLWWTVDQMQQERTLAESSDRGFRASFVNLPMR